MKEEDDGTSSDGTDQESSSLAPSVSRVTSSTNGNGTGASSVSVISSPLRRTLEAEANALKAARQHLLGNALVALGTEVANAALGSEAASSLFLHDFATRNQITTGTGHKSSGSDGSSSASPLSLSMTKPGPKPRAADSPGSGSTTSTTATPGRDKVFICQICNRSFGYKHVLQNHERTHTGEKPFECRECHKRFTRDHHLKTHMRLHTGEKPYHCTHCERQFVQVANLRRHLRVHTGERPYACELCSSKFSDSNQLKAHMLIHKGEKPFECIKCLGRFRRRHHLMHHKCPKDAENIGKPRRGRRPRAYETLTPANLLLARRTISPGDEAQSLPGVAAATVSSSTAVLAAAATSSFFPFQPAVSVPVTLPLCLPSSTPPAAHSASGSLQPVVSSGTATKSRRKQRTTTRILTPQQRELFLQDTNTMQTQPLNMSRLIPMGSSVPRASNYLTAGNLTAGHHEDVLDLSRSRSDVDSEAEPIEEEVMEDDDLDEELDDPYDSDQYDEDSRIPTSVGMTFPMVATSYRSRSLIPGVPGISANLKVKTEKIVGSSDVAQDIMLHNKRHNHGSLGHHLDENSSDGDGNGNGGVDSVEEEENGPPIALTKGQSASF